MADNILLQQLLNAWQVHNKINPLLIQSIPQRDFMLFLLHPKEELLQNIWNL